MSETELYRQTLQTLLRHDLTASERAQAEKEARQLLYHSEEGTRRKPESYNVQIRGRSWAAAAWLTCRDSVLVSSTWQGDVAGFRLVRTL